MVEIQPTIDTSEIKERKADDRGRVRLGPEYAGRDVEVVVLDADEDEE